MPYSSGKRPKTATSETRDEQDHFIPKTDQASHESNPFLDSLTPKIEKTSDQNTSLDVHVGNPLRMITQIVEEIKKQKGFSFILKGALGVIGVILILSIVGVFSGNRILCDKGIQTQIGILRLLTVQQEDSPEIPIIGTLIDSYRNLIGIPTAARHPRMILLTHDSTITLPYNTKVPFTSYVDQPVMATGTYDSCSRVLQVTNPTALQSLR